MKTLTERMDDLLEQIIYCDFRTEIGIDKAKTLIRRALKTEQKLIRHACAENVIQLNDENIFSLNDNILSDAKLFSWRSRTSEKKYSRAYYQKKKHEIKKARKKIAHQKLERRRKQLQARGTEITATGRSKRLYHTKGHINEKYQEEIELRELLLNGN